VEAHLLLVSQRWDISTDQAWQVESRQSEEMVHCRREPLLDLKSKRPTAFLPRIALLGRLAGETLFRMLFDDRRRPWVHHLQLVGWFFLSQCAEPFDW
jgi:hypothetical protein